MTSTLRRKRASDDAQLSWRSGTSDGEARFDDGIHRVDADNAAHLENLQFAASTRRFARVLARCNPIPTSSHHVEAELESNRKGVDSDKPVSASVHDEACSSPKASKSEAYLAHEVELNKWGIEYKEFLLSPDDKELYISYNMRHVYARLKKDLGRDWWREGDDHASEA